MINPCTHTRDTHLVLYHHALNLIVSKYQYEVQDSGMGLCVADLECNLQVIVVTAHACWNDVHMHVVYYSHKLKHK